MLEHETHKRAEARGPSVVLPRSEALHGIVISTALDRKILREGVSAGAPSNVWFGIWRVSGGGGGRGSEDWLVVGYEDGGCVM